jgi:hypothetical protein
VTKPIATIEVIATLLGMLKTGIVVLTMVLLEAAKMDKAKAKLGEAKAKNDLAVEKVKHAKPTHSDNDTIDAFLASKMPDRTGNSDPSSSNP